MGQTPGGTLEIIDAQNGESRLIALDKTRDVSPFRNGVEAFSRALLDGETFPFAPARDLHTMNLLHTAMAQAGGTFVEEPSA